jgi:hypothetical protein
MHAPHPAGRHHLLQQQGHLVVADTGVGADLGAGHQRGAGRGGAAVQHLQNRHRIDERAARHRLVPPALVLHHRQRRRQQRADQGDQPGQVHPQQEQRQRRQRAVDDGVGRELADEDREHALGDLEGDRRHQPAPQRVAPVDPAVRHRHVEQRVGAGGQGHRHHGVEQRADQGMALIRPVVALNSCEVRVSEKPNSSGPRVTRPSRSAPAAPAGADA